MSEPDSNDDPNCVAMCIRRACTIDEEQRRFERHTVFCSRRGQTVPLGDCSACPQFQRLMGNCDDGWTHVRCTPGRTQDTAGRIAEIMSANVLCVSPEVGLEQLARLFMDRGVTGAPVVDGQGRPLGVVTESDLLRELRETGGESSKRRVADLMTPIPFTTSEHAPIPQTAGLMAFEGIHRAPVVSETGEVVGMVSALDLLRWFAARAGYLALR